MPDPALRDHAEAPPIGRGRQPHAPAEEPPEERHVFVADGARDVLGGRVATLEELLGLLDAQRLHVLEGVRPVAASKRRLNVRSGSPA